jgi:hypothetical protein
VSEVDMMAAELRKPVHFDVKLVSRLKNGIFHAEVCVEMRHKLSGQVWTWSKEKFLNRTYIMREIYDLYVQVRAVCPHVLLTHCHPSIRPSAHPSNPSTRHRPWHCRRLSHGSTDDRSACWPLRCVCVVRATIDRVLGALRAGY